MPRVRTTERIRLPLGVMVLVLTLSGGFANAAAAAPQCTPTLASLGRCPTPQAVVLERDYEHWDVGSTVTGDSSLVLVRTEAWSRSPDDAVRVEVERQGGHSATVELPIYCRRDDYAFLPPNANGGLPCLAARTDRSIDPETFAHQLVQSVSLPPVRLRMNPQLGLVAVPTWFWVEGYDGGVFGSAEALLLVRRTCQLVVLRDARGDPVLDENRRPRVREVCTSTSNTVNVEVRLWPKEYTWDFGDRHGQPVECGGVGPCVAGLGEAYTDIRHPSPIQHAYTWTSLHQGDDDAYRIGLAIEFGAQFRLSFNGSGGTGWRDVPQRFGAWSASHKVQEAQAILTRP